MTKEGPIILIDDDEDDHEVIKEALLQLNIKNKLLYFENGEKALQYLTSSAEQPFIIFSDINMPILGGIELRELINKDENLRNKSVPFIFLTTTASPRDIKRAYDMCVQGFFQKGSSMEEIKTLIKEVYDYWQKCRNPNNP